MAKGALLSRGGSVYGVTPKAASGWEGGSSFQAYLFSEILPLCGNFLYYRHMPPQWRTIIIKEDDTMTTYDFICNHLENDYPDAIPVMDEYLMAWLEDMETVDVIYPYLAALKALTDADVEGAEKYIVELRTEEVGS